ncbi:hypothetical protein VKT23_020401 [Stygiomarasmius scandens]|uniref:Uncharacterized protein n=1 Tax=Marasmiellus scandens TaxID=2682957 RepID=A0ABR1IJ73_9AGAR
MSSESIDTSAPKSPLVPPIPEPPSVPPTQTKGRPNCALISAKPTSKSPPKRRRRFIRLRCKQPPLESPPPVQIEGRTRLVRIPHSQYQHQGYYEWDHVCCDSGEWCEDCECPSDCPATEYEEEEEEEEPEELSGADLAEYEKRKQEFDEYIMRRAKLKREKRGLRE